MRFIRILSNRHGQPTTLHHRAAKEYPCCCEEHARSRCVLLLLSRRSGMESSSSPTSACRECEVLVRNATNRRLDALRCKPGHSPTGLRIPRRPRSRLLQDKRQWLTLYQHPHGGDGAPVFASPGFLRETFSQLVKIPGIHGLVYKFGFHTVH